MTKNDLFFLTGFMLIHFLSTAQKQKVEITQIPLDLFTNKSMIMDMEQDTNGNLWMLRGLDGLTKYDGEKTKLYSPNPYDPNSITSGRLETMVIDKKGIIWIATFNAGIDRFDPITEKFTNYRHDPKIKSSLRSDIVRAMIVDDDGFIWVGTDKGLDKFDPKTGEFLHLFSEDPDLKALNKVHVRTLFIDKSGVLWIGGGSPFVNEDSNPGGLFKYDLNKDEITPYFHSEENTSLIDNRVGAIFEDSRGIFWVGTAGDGLHTMDRNKGTFTRHRLDQKSVNNLSRPPLGDVIDYAVDYITFINEDEQGFIWIGTYEGGLNRFDPVSEKNAYYGMENFGSVSLWNFFKSKDNLIWISFWGVNNQKERLVKINISPQDFKYEELGYVVQSIIELEDGEILLGTEGGLMAMDTLGNINQKILTSDRIFQNMSIERLVKDAENNLWISTNEGAYFYTNSSNTVKAYKHNPNNKNSISSDGINVILPVNESCVLIGTDVSGLDVLNMKDGSIKNYSHNAQDKYSVSANYISSLTQDSEGTIWVGTGLGINTFDLKSRRFKSYNLKGAVGCAFEDSNNRIWIAARRSGLMYYDKEKDKFVSFLDETGVLGSFYDIKNITEDHQGNLWLKTSLGVIKLNLEMEATYLMADLAGGTLYNSPTVFTSSKGKVFFGELTGFIEWDGNQSANNKLINVPYIDKFYINNELVEEGQNDILPNRFSQTESITLKYFQNSFSFDYGHVDFITPARRHTIQFKLENYDNYWRASKGENRANYVKVPPGNYVLNIRASNPGGVWSSRSVKMVILNPWYQTGWAYLLFTLLGASLLRGYIIYRSRKLKAENIFLEEKVAKRTAALKASQAQLIHSEKMASLGELTAGIAHEIQNPLNFVNNFSEINQELLEEVEEEIGNGNLEDAKDIIHDLKENEQKISEHGKRADSIVKGMLLHSRNSTGEKIETDINALCDEYLRLSYHGMRAKNRDFNVDFELNMDPDLPKVKVVPQDMGRVLLNIINNAFQALTDFKERNETSDKASSPVRGGLETFKGVNSPKVFVSTKRVATPLGDGGREQAIQITISDNGPGIPDYLKEKIFQPFFTTKATGEGTGLGLSLAYDIVKAHGGEIKVESEEGGGARFTLYLPVIN